MYYEVIMIVNEDNKGRLVGDTWKENIILQGQ